MLEAELQAVIGAIHAWRKSCAGVQGPMRLSDLARHAQALSEAIPVVEKEPISCRKGCSACCRQVIPLSPPEAFLLAEGLGALPGKEAVLERFGAIATRLEVEGLRDSPLFSRAGEYFRLGLSCPFLVDEACSIHAHRPLVCREHLAVSPAAYCADFPDAFIRMHGIALSVREALAELAGECAGTGMEMIPLSGALGWIELHLALGQRTWDGEWLLDRLASLCLSGLESGLDHGLGYSAVPG